MDATRGYLYLKDDGAFFKLGKTVNPSRRENDYLTENLRIRKLDEMVFASPEEASVMEKLLLQETSTLSVENCNGNSTEWRKRSPEVIKTWIAFKEKHSLVNVSEWAEVKADLIAEIESLHLTQLYTKQEADCLASGAVSAAESLAEQEKLDAIKQEKERAERLVSSYHQRVQELAKDAENKLHRERCQRMQVEAAAKQNEELLKKQAEELWVKREAEHKAASKMQKDFADAEINRLKAAALHNKAEGAFASAIEGCKSFAQGFTNCEVGDSPEDTFGAIALAFAGVSAVAVTCFICLLFTL